MPTMREKILDYIKDHIKDGAFGSATFEFNGKVVYEYLLSDWGGQQNEVLVVWSPDKPPTETPAEEAKNILCEVASSMLKVDVVRNNLKRTAGTVWEWVGKEKE